jgi:hypothetical protein
MKNFQKIPAAKMKFQLFFFAFFFSCSLKGKITCSRAHYVILPLSEHSKNTQKKIPGISFLLPHGYLSSSQIIFSKSLFAKSFRGSSQKNLEARKLASKFFFDGPRKFFANKLFEKIFCDDGDIHGAPAKIL